MRSGAPRRGRERRRRQALIVAEGREARAAGRHLQAGRHRWEENRRREAALVLGGEVHGELLGLGLGLTAARRREEAAAASGIGAPVLVHGGGCGEMGLSRTELGFRRSASRGVGGCAGGEVL